MKPKEKSTITKEKSIFVVNSLIFACVVIMLNSCKSTKTSMIWKCYDYYYDSTMLEINALVCVQLKNSSKDTILLMKGMSYCSYNYRKIIGEEVFGGYFLITDGKDSMILDDACSESIMLIPPSSRVEIPLFVRSINKNVEGEIFLNTIDSILTNGQMIYISPEDKLNDFELFKNYNKLHAYKINKEKRHNCSYNNSDTKSKQYIEWEKELENIKKESGVPPRE